MPSVASGHEGLADFVARVVAKADLPLRLSECGVEPHQLTLFAADAAKQWTGTFNPRPVGEAELLELYTKAM
jgi:alcohol dehydrogenase